MEDDYIIGDGRNGVEPKLYRFVPSDCGDVGRCEKGLGDNFHEGAGIRTRRRRQERIK